MSLQKSYWSVDGDNISTTVNLTKVDKENRLVTGFASLDNVDRQGDRILHEANQRAFSKFRGNIREMHQPIAAGRIVDFKEDSFYHEGQLYKGIKVTAYISKGAPSTWEKVCDGTLTGFSIGGAVTDSAPSFTKELGSHRIIKDYNLVELSLVDSPANQLANIVSVQKVDGETLVKGMVAEVEGRNAFFCPTDETSKDSVEDSEICPVCEEGMDNIGWFEIVGGDDVAKHLSALIEKHTTQNGEGVKNVSENNKTDNAEVVTSADVENKETEEAKAAEVEVPVVEEEAKVVTEEVTTDEPDFEKMVSELKDVIEKGHTQTAEERAALEERLVKFETASSERFDEMEKKFKSFEETAETMKSAVAEMEKSLSVLDKSTALKKSGEVEITDTVEKSSKSSTFGGAFGLSNLDD